MKRSKLSTYIGTAALVALPGLSLAQAAPNVLLIIADDMGIDASNCYAMGNQQARMPNIEAMCQQGMVFDNAYSAPVCSPTRATILTGQYGFRTGVGAAIPPQGTNGLSADANSLFDVLEASQYSTNLLGKWHLAGSDDSLNHPAELGVSDFWGLFKGGVRDYYKWTAVTAAEEVDVNQYSTTAMTNEALEWINDQDNSWFLWLAYNAPHSPFHLPPNDLHSADDLPNTERNIKQNPLPYYNAMLEALDTEIGRLLASMDQSVRDNTIIMFVGDNGTPNQVVDDFYGDHKAKGTIFESGVNVPLVVTGPGIESGRSPAFVQTSDMFTTIAAMLGVEAEAEDSFSFEPALYGNATQRDFVYVEHFGDMSEAKPSDVFGWAMRQGDYKLLMQIGEQPALYNLATDPKEADDLLADGISAEEAAIVASLQQRYQQLATQ
ncbi:sulfatase-like hydrolase/transferase [Reinekea marinisedimentorum]|uniref:Arylsulfatase A-like enzyme n=1 Tax=Reinekea marinisedimentorum TaxID=230495 RepID=A0A4R3IB06_9GAMM|nr:sulfatase-like hydrolase/transferase [Reinekea marinisedimentorum]TCS43779.1 arylsulfatase A-like enzyme [Reinekea marinisedimentorum]